jgi:hypothetical protein
MDIYFAQDLAKELGVSEHELWRAYNAVTTPEATIRRQRRREAAKPDGAVRYVPVSLAGHVLQNPDLISKKVFFKEDTD